MNNDTIVAQVTPPGIGGVGILRVSGTRVIEVVEVILRKKPKPRYANYLPFYDTDGKILDQGIAIYFPAPNSFTGEDVLELQGHGGPVIIDLLLKQILSINKIRIANPGEFSERAFLNDKIDLVQAEAIADLIEASTECAARLAVNSLQGIFSKNIYEIVELLTNLRIHIEAAIDFPNEGIEFLSNDKIKVRLSKIIDCLNNVRSQAYQGSLLREGMKVVIAGSPNVGKSSLLNVLSGHEAAIVTNIAGTTRDVLREYINVDGILLHIIDTAGLCKSVNEIEKIGINRAWQEISQADHILFMVDTSTTRDIELEKILSDFIIQLQKKIPITVIKNKVDITNEPVMITKINDHSLIYLSVHQRKGIDLLCQHLKKSFGLNQCIEGKFLARRRHIQFLDIAMKHLQQGYQQLVVINSVELLAEELRLAQQILSNITGEFSSSDLLSSIFSSFCIGK